MTKKPTIAERLRVALEARGWELDPNARSLKYVTMTKDGIRSRYYIGPNGALRYGLTASASRSVPRTSKHLLDNPIPDNIPDK